VPLDPETLDPDPLVELARWIAEAEAAGHELASAFALATADASGRPSVRLILLRGLEPDGLRFYTNRESAKGRDLAANPRAAATFWWERTHRQIRISGRVEPLDDAEADAYWATRPRGHQLATWASAQSEPIADRAALEGQVADVEMRFPGEEALPRPAYWSGYRLVPKVVELWESREDRLHDRIEYRRIADGTWEKRRLQP
jgi:pyridoxamine 5'-phosphate oxidase